MPYFVRGIPYNTIKDAAMAIPVAPAVISVRCTKQNETVQEALNHFVKREERKKRLESEVYTVREVEYKTVQEAMQAVPIGDSAFRHYLLETNCTYQQALNHFISETNKFVFDIRGKKIATLRDACAAVPCSPESVRRYCKRHNCSQQEAIDYYIRARELSLGRVGNRYRRCVVCKRCLLMTKEEALDFKHSDTFCETHEVAIDKNRRSGDFRAGDLEWLTFQLACSKACLDDGAVTAYADEHSVTLQEAIDALVTVKSEKVRVILGIRCLTYNQMADVLGVDRTLFVKQKNKHGLDATIDFYLKTRVEDVVTINGVKYRGEREIAKTLGVGISTWGSWKRTFPSGTPMQDIVDTRLGLKSDIRGSNPAYARRFVEKNEAVRKGLVAIRSAYIGTDNQGYFFCTCAICGRRLLLSETVLSTYVHSDKLCILYESPL